MPRSSVFLTALLVLQLAVPTAGSARKIRFAAAQHFESGASSPGCLATGDFNGDGYPDLVVANHYQTLAVLINKGDGTFKAPVTYTTDFYVTGCVAVADFNGDKKLDLLAVGGDDLGNGLALLLGNGDGTFSSPIYTPTSLAGASLSVAVGDLNGDGNLDLFVGGNGSSEDIFGDGKGHFQDGHYQNASGFDVALADFNGDGNLDAAATDDSGGTVSILLGNGDGTFQMPQVYNRINVPTGIALADFNRDKKLDLAVAVYNDASALILLGNGDGTFTIGQEWSADLSPGKVIVQDFNKDGNVDLALSDFDGGDVSVLAGDGTGKFPTTFNFSSGTNPTYVASADFNRDGSPDLAVTNYGDNTVSVFLNAAGTFMTLTSKPNPSKYGEPVTLTARAKGSVERSQIPTGWVTFKDGSTVLGKIRLQKGVASLKISSLSKGRHQIRALYSGDDLFNPNTSSVLVQIVK